MAVLTGSDGLTVALNVITGGPGCGKSTIISELAQRGYTTIDEAARSIIIEEKIKESNKEPYVLPETDLAAFQILVYNRQRFLEQEARKVGGILYADRGIIDNVGYCNAARIPVSHDLHTLCCTASYRHVFLLDPLPDYLYKNDGVRPETREESLRLTKHIEDAYLSYGYKVICVPFMQKEERAEYIERLAI